MARLISVVSGLSALDRNNSFPFCVHRIYLWFCLFVYLFGFFLVFCGFFCGFFCSAHHEPGSTKTREIN